VWTVQTALVVYYPFSNSKTVKTVGFLI